MAMESTMAGHPVRVARDGKPYTGSYIVQDGIITVFFGSDSKAAELGEVEPDSMARIMLGELVKAEPREGHIKEGDGREPSPSNWRLPEQKIGADLNEEERHILCSLGAGVLLQWNDLSNDVQSGIFESAVAAASSDHSGRLRQHLAIFLHNHKDDKAV